MNIVIADKLDEQSHPYLEDTESTVIVDPLLSNKYLIDVIKEHRADLLTICSTKVNNQKLRPTRLYPSLYA